MRKRKSPIARSLLRNSKSAMFAAIEIHNKPIFAYRYEVSILLLINAWELLLKAYIYKYLKKVKLFQKDGRTKPFDECVGCVAANLGKDFESVKESLETLYKYRNKVAHFYSERLDTILFSLMKANVGFYVEFILKHFKVDLSLETNLILLPIGFVKPLSPIEFLSNKSSLANAPKEVIEFIDGIVESSKRLKKANIKDSILVDYRMNLTNEKRIKNADIIAGITNAQPQAAILKIESSLDKVRLSDDPDAKVMRVVEEDLYETLFTEEYYAVVANAKSMFEDFQRGRRFNRIMKEIKKDESLHRTRYLDPHNPKSAHKDWYSKKIYKELSKHYKLRKV